MLEYWTNKKKRYHLYPAAEPIVFHLHSHLLSITGRPDQYHLIVYRYFHRIIMFGVFSSEIDPIPYSVGPVDPNEEKSRNSFVLFEELSFLELV